MLAITILAANKVHDCKLHHFIRLHQKGRSFVIDTALLMFTPWVTGDKS